MSEERKKVSLNVVPDAEKMARKLEQTENTHKAQSQQSDPANSEGDMLLPPADWPIERKLLHGKIVAVLKSVYDPEIPVDIYELGLIYNIDISADNAVRVRMTLTAPGCPVAGELVAEVENKVENIPEVKEASVDLVWDPPWTRERMSEAARLHLGLF
jgi:FeS assembly SUF system protein